MNPKEQEKRNNPAYGLMAIPAVLIIAVAVFTIYGLNKK